MDIVIRRRLILILCLLSAACGSQGVATTTRGLPSLPQEIGNLSSTTGAIPSPTFTMPTPYPTLPKALQEQLYGLFKTNANCEFPCFLGITPGESDLSEAFAFFERYSASHRVFTLDVTFEAPYRWYHTYAFSISRGNYEIPVDVEIQADGGNTRGLIVHIEDGQGTDNEQIQERPLERYGLEELLQRHGVPDEVYLQPPKAQPPPPASPSPYEWYILDVVYQEQKIFASYPGWAKFSPSQGKYELCPEIGDGQIDTFSI